jgi:hypothetical protein
MTLGRALSLVIYHLSLMKKLLPLFLLMSILAACTLKPAARQEIQSASHDSLQTELSRPLTVVEWQTGVSHDFGVYKEKVEKSHTFVFRNVGEVPFVIDSLVTICSCTHADYVKRPVLPGEVDSIRLSYSGNGFVPGYFHQSCWVYGNMEAPVKLEVHGVFDHAE